MSTCCTTGRSTTLGLLEPICAVLRLDGTLLNVITEKLRLIA
jgi:hypothetical protein